MPIPELSDSLDQVLYTHPAHRVYLTDALTNYSQLAGVELGGALNRQVYCNSLTLRAAPEIDSADLVYDVAYQIPIGKGRFEQTALGPSDFLGQAVRIEIDDTSTTVDADKKPVIWFGIITGATTHGAGIGQILLTALGVLHLADKDPIHSAFSLDYPGTAAIETGLGRPFNTDAKDVWGPIGNRAAAKLAGADHLLFSFEDRGRSVWTAQEAVIYLLSRHAPLDSTGTAQPAWVLDTDTAADKPADWYDLHLQTDGQSLKQLLDALIPRKRAMSYWASYDSAQQKIVVRMFTFVATDLTVGTTGGGSPRIIPANDDQYTVDPSTNFWFTADFTVNESVEAQYDLVTAFGEQCTSTCTLTFATADKQFIKDWSAADETAYKTAKGPSSEDINANTQYRCEDKMDRVYCRFRLSDEFNGRTTFEGFEYFIDPPYDTDGNPVPLYDAGTNATGQPMRVRGLFILPRLPFSDRLDYSGNNLEGLALQTAIAAAVAAGEGDGERNPPFFLLPLTAGGYVHLDKASVATATSTSDDKRKWSAHVHRCEHEPSIELRVPNKRQTLIARADFTSPGGPYDMLWDPVANNGADWHTFKATVCLEMERRLKITQTINAGITDRPTRPLELTVAGARLDYVCPHTIVDLDKTTPKRTDTGGYVRDDRPRVRSLVKATAEWYGRVKRAVEFTYKQPRKLLQIGSLITEVGGNILTQDINTPVTTITYSLGAGQQGGSTKVQTGFAEVDFS